jgi:hypothetical protein
VLDRARQLLSVVKSAGGGSPRGASSGRPSLSPLRFDSEIQKSDVRRAFCDTWLMAELDDLVGEMATLLEAPCTLEDADFNLIGFSGQSDVDGVRQRSIMERRSSTEIRDWFHAQGIRDADGPIRTRAEPALGIQARLCVPAHHLNRVHGYFWLLDPGHRIPEDLWPAAARIAEVAALLLSQSNRRQTRLNLFYRDLVEGDRGAARAAARELASAAGFSINEPVTCVMVERPPSTDSLASQPRHEGILWLEESPAVTVAIVRGRVTGTEELTEVLLERLGSPRRRRSADTVAWVGIGPTVGSLEDVRRARWGAETSLRVARTMAPGTVVDWRNLGALKLLAAAADHDLADALFDERLRDFVRNEKLSELKLTAKTYLDHAGSIARTSEQLRIHRQSLYHRLDQVERATGLDLKNGRDRLYLHLVLSIEPLLPGQWGD